MKHSNWVLSALGLLAAGAVPAAELTISCGTAPTEAHLCEQPAMEWARATGNTVRILPAPQQTNDRYAAYTEAFEAQSAELDVVEIDLIWPTALGDHLVDLAPLLGADGQAGHHPKLIDNATVDGRLVAIPWSVSVGLLYFRYDLLMRYDRPVPRTWAELEETARYVQAQEREAGHENFWGYVFQGAAYEGLTCNALEWIASSDGGNLVDAAGNVTLDRPAAVAAVERAAGWIGDISPPRVVSYNEEATRLAFQSGNALFMRNWPYAWQLMQRDPNSPISGLFLAAPMPAGDDGGMRAGTLGGWYLAVSRYSKHPEEAADLVRHLTSASVQSLRAIDGSLAPTRIALYRDGDVLRSNPGFAAMLPMLERAVLRPSRVKGEHYMASSEAFARRVNAALAGDEPAGAALAAARKEIEGR